MEHPIYQKNLFNQKVYLVTGGGSGLGLQIAKELGCLGASIFICGRTEEKLINAQALLNEDDIKCEYAVCDLRLEDDVKKMVSACMEKFGRIDGLVNNAGGQFPCPTKDLSLRGWESVVQNNLTSIFLTSKEVLNQSFMKIGEGAIVNILAQNKNGMPYMAHSGAARAGVENFTMTAAYEWAQYKVRINSVAPGIIETSGLDTYSDEFKKILPTLKPKIPLKRFGTSSEVSAMVLFLLSPAGSYMTGSHIRIDGGVSLSGQVIDLPNYEANQPYTF